MRMGKGSASEDARSTAIQGYGPEASWEVSFTDAQIKFHVRLASHPAAHMHPKLNRGGTRVVFASNRDGDFEIYSIAAGIQSIGVYHNDFAALAHENQRVQPGMVYELYLLGGTSALTNGNLEAGLSGWTTAGRRPPVASADSFRGAPVAAGQYIFDITIVVSLTGRTNPNGLDRPYIIDVQASAPTERQVLNNGGNHMLLIAEQSFLPAIR